MMYDITIEIIQANSIKISSEEGSTRYYDMYTWKIGDAVEDYIETEFM